MIVLIAMKDIASHTRIKPLVRQAKLQQFIDNVHNNTKARQHLEDWGMSLDIKPFETEGRTMGADKVVFGNDLRVGVGPKAEWSREACNNRLFQSINVEKWLMVCTKKDSVKTDEFVKTLKLVTRNMGFNFGDPRRAEVADESPMAYTMCVKKYYMPDDQIVVMMTPGSSQREDRYNAIKRLCCCEISKPSQVVRANTLTDTKMRSVCQKIAIQISCKIGGQPWAIPIPFKSCMIVGIDVYHDPTTRGKSVVGIVASINGAVTRWYTRAYFQNTHEEIVNTLESGIVSCLKKYYDLNNFLPQRIFIYRDGVSDGQLAIVRDYEVVQIENAIMDFGKAFADYMPTISVIIVQKRINTKLLLKLPNGFDNPAPGSVLDHSVTRKNYYDFFLISQFVNQGTVTPTHYIVLHDTNEMPPDRMQKLSYKMTHLYYNWPGTIRVPAPCQVSLTLLF
jgi:aubergine-like protein